MGATRSPSHQWRILRKCVTAPISPPGHSKCPRAASSPACCSTGCTEVLERRHREGERPPNPESGHGDPPGSPDPPSPGDDGCRPVETRAGRHRHRGHPCGPGGGDQAQPRFSAISSIWSCGNSSVSSIPTLSNAMWEDYLDDCRGRDADMPLWNESTRRRLRSSVFQTLAQTGYLADTRSLKLQPVHIARQVIDYLQDHDEAYVLRCIQVSP